MRACRLLPLTSQLQALRNNVTNDRLDRADSVASDSNAPFAERALITSRVGTASGGINTAALSRNTGGSGLGGRETTQVENPVEGFVEAGGAAQRTGDSNKASRSPKRSNASSTRTRAASSRSTIVRYARTRRLKARWCSAHDHARGRVTFCEIVSSELGDAELERGLVQRVLQLQFELATTSSPHDDEADRLLPGLTFLLYGAPGPRL